MRAIHFWGRKYTGTGRLAEKIADAMQCRLLNDKDLIEAATRDHGLKASEIEKAVFEPSAFPDRFSAKKARAVSGVKMTLANELQKGLTISWGFLGTLIPRKMSLHLLTTASPEFRIKQMVRDKGFQKSRLSEKILEKEDRAFLHWAHYLQTIEHLTADRYDAVVDAEHSSLQDVIQNISHALDRKAGRRTPEDFSKEAEIEWIMAENGYPVSATARKKHITLTLHHQPLILSRYQKKISMIAQSIQSVESVSVSPSPFFYRADIYRHKEFTLPSERILKAVEGRYRKLYRKASGKKMVFMQKTADLQPRIQI